MICKKCGKEIPNDSIFCPECGQNPNELNNKKEKPKKRHIVLKVLLALLVCIFILLALSYYFHIGIWIPKKEKENDATVNEQYRNGTVYSLDDKNVAYDEASGVNYVNNIIIIFFTDAATEEEKEQLFIEIGGTVAGSIPSLNQYQIKIEEKSYDELCDLCAQLETYSFVDSALIDIPVRLSEDVVPEDPWKKTLFFFGEKWSEENPGGSNWWQETINAPSAWEYNEFLERIDVGIVDSGFELEHEDLKGVIKDTTANNEADDHGTHVAGIIGAKANNKCGITGILWNTDLHTWDWELTKKQEDSGDETYSNWNSITAVLTGTVDLIENSNSKIINLSLGQTSFMEETTRSEEEVDLQGKNASAYLVKLLEDGYDFVIVQSAGNGNKEGYSVDARYNGLFCSISAKNCAHSDSIEPQEVLDRIIVVGAAKKSGKNKYIQAEFSNAGDRVDICAPGYEVYSTVPGGYKNMSGTSMAAPIVSGVASLVWSADPSLTGSEVKQIVCGSANTKYTVSDNTSKYHPLTNEYKMVNAYMSVKAAIDAKMAAVKKETRKTPASEKELKEEPITFSGLVITPKDVVLKMFSSLHDGNYDSVATCFNPQTEQNVRLIGGLASGFVGYLTGEKISWSDLLFNIAGATDVEVLKCSSYNHKYSSTSNVFNDIINQISGADKLICSEADVYVKFRYKLGEDTYILEDTFHVKRYGTKGFRIEIGNNFE